MTTPYIPPDIPPSRATRLQDIQDLLRMRGAGPSLGMPDPTDPSAVLRAQLGGLLTPQPAPAPDDGAFLHHLQSLLTPAATPAVPTVAPDASRVTTTKPAPFDPLALADMGMSLLGFDLSGGPAARAQPGRRAQNALALATLGVGGLADFLTTRKLAGDAADLLGRGATFDVATGREATGSGYLVADPEYTKTIFPHENPRQAIQSFLSEPANRARLQRPGAHLGVYTNPDGLPEVNVTDRLPLDQGEGAARALGHIRGQHSIGHMVDGQYIRDIPISHTAPLTPLLSPAAQQSSLDALARVLPGPPPKVPDPLDDATFLRRGGHVPSLNVAPSDVPDVAEVGAAYRTRAGLTHAPLPPVDKVDADAGRAMAQTYDGLTNAPDDPQVQHAYRALVSETRAQAHALREAGYTWTYVDKDPYKNSAEMLQDLNDNHAIKVLKTAPGQEHPLLSNDENNLFRAVHDILGHGTTGASFGPRGEEQAFRNHAALFSPEAQRALATETRGQNSWFNFGPHADQPVGERPFAQQKAALWPANQLGDYPDVRDATGPSTALVPYEPKSTALAPYRDPQLSMLAQAASAPMPTTPTNIIAQGLSKEDAVAQMKALGKEGARAQMRPNPDGTFSIVRKGAAQPGTALAAPKAPPTPMGLLGQPVDEEAGFSSRLLNSVAQNPKYADLKLSPKDWYDRLKNDPNVPKDELEQMGLHDPGNGPTTAEIETRAENMRQAHSEKYGMERRAELDERDRQLDDFDNFVREEVHGQTPEIKDAAEKYIQAIHAHFPGLSDLSGEVDPISGIHGHDDVAAALEHFTDQLGYTYDDENAIRRRVIPAREAHNRAVAAHNALVAPPNFLQQAHEEMVGDGPNPFVLSSRQSLLDEKGRLSQGNLMKHIRGNSPVARLERQTLSGAGGVDSGEPSEEDIGDRANELESEWRDDRSADARDAMQKRDEALVRANEAMQQLFGDERGKVLHEQLVADYFADPRDVLNERSNRNLPDHLDEETFAHALGGLLGEPPDPAQGTLPLEGTPPALSHNDLVPIARAYQKAIAWEGDAITHMEDYHDAGNRGPDFNAAAREQLTGDIEPTVMDKGDTQYADYQRVDKTAPYREILIRDPEQEDYNAPHFQDAEGGSLGLIAHARGEIHGDTYLMLEAQSDFAQRARRQPGSKMAKIARRSSVSVFLPTEKWAQLSTGASLRQAAEEGSDKFAWVTPENRVSAAHLDIEAGNITYKHAVPNAVERIFKYLGEPLSPTTLDVSEHTSTGPFPAVKLTAAMREKILKYGVPALGTLPFLTPGQQKTERPTLR